MHTRKRTYLKITSPSSAKNEESVDDPGKNMILINHSLKKILVQSPILYHTNVEHKGTTIEPVHRKTKVVSKIKINTDRMYKIEKCYL